jgi:hypothetical protein
VWNPSQDFVIQMPDTIGYDVDERPEFQIHSGMLHLAY